MDTSTTSTSAPLVTLTEPLLENFAATMQVASFDEHLFDVSAGGNLGAKLDAIMAAVQAADVQALLRAQRPLFALLCADAEARIAFALARNQAQTAVAAAGRAAIQTATVLEVLETAYTAVSADNARLADVGAMAQNLLTRLAPPVTTEQAELRARFDRRLTHLTSLRAATALILAQLPEAIAHNKQLLERFVDIQNVLFPVWERHALTLMQSPRDAAKLADDLAGAARAMGVRLLDGQARAA